MGSLARNATSEAIHQRLRVLRGSWGMWLRIVISGVLAVSRVLYIVSMAIRRGREPNSV